MNRILLALLALLSGLTVSAAPASARLCGAGETEFAASACERSGPATKGAQTQASDGTAARAERREREIQRARPAGPKVFIPSVQFGADRAFE
ncbi:MAG: hypothetical protein ACREBO_12470 [Novosphingobium sp.]